MNAGRGDEGSGLRRLEIGWTITLVSLLAILAGGTGDRSSAQVEPTPAAGVGFLTAVAGQGSQPTGEPVPPAGVGFQTAVAQLLTGDEPTATAAPEPEDPLGSRLGGSRASFESRYGVPTGGDERTGAFYQVRGYGLVFVQFGDGLVTSISLAPQRPADKPASQPDPADWTLDKARELAGRFLPADVQLGSESAEGGGLTGIGRSEALAAAIGPGGGQPGECLYRFATTVAGRVSLITITLAASGQSSEQPADDPSDRCAGIEEWATGTNQRVDRSLAIAGEIDTLDPNAAGVASQLHDWSQEFLRLTEQQRQGSIPPAAREINPLIVGAFNAYSLTMDLLSIALVTGDIGAVDAAFVALDTATANFERAASLLDPVVQECG